MGGGEDCRFFFLRQNGWEDSNYQKLPICSFALATDLDVIQVMQINSNPPSLCPWWAPLSSSCHTHSSPVPQVQPLCRGERQRRAQPWALCGTWDKNQPLDKPKIESEKLCFSGLTFLLDLSAIYYWFILHSLFIFVQIIHLVRDPRAHYNSIRSSSSGWEDVMVGKIKGQDNFGEVCRVEVEDLKVAADAKKDKYD